MISDIGKLIKQGEGINLEFKEAATRLPKNIFETICAFLNTEGGTILIGVTDEGKVKGVDPDSVNKIKTDLVNLSNNPQKIDPVFVLSVNETVYKKKTLIIVHVPVGSQVHKCTGDIY
ncbi:MAG: putative DNA binding domain-containing protein, partial [Deltaproteobacteria bacterium]|nr:putative DNA binding domain-containing protein [Deltaproteobacteria bacterium]